MPKAYAIVYWIGCPKKVGTANWAQEFQRAACAPGASYDRGDDPSFFSAELARAPVTWGVCRPILRRSIDIGDTIVFFGVEHVDGVLQYTFKGFATVQLKISQTALWKEARYATYRSYLNLLVRPSSAADSHYEWHEEVAEHQSWAWRMSDPRGHKKSDFEAISNTGGFVDGKTTLKDGSLFLSGANYVVFQDHRQGTTILSKPPVVAVAPPLRERQLEVWEKRSPAARLRALTVEKSSGPPDRGLKTINPYTAHPPLRLKLVTKLDTWRDELVSLIRSAGWR